MKDNATDTIYGIRAVMEAIHSGKEIDKILMKKGLTGELSLELVNLMKEKGLTPQIVPTEKFLQYGNKTHQGVVAFLSPIDFQPLEEVVARIWEKGEAPFIVLLDSVTDVRNFGAIVRTAECAGAHAVVFPIKGSARISSDAVKTSAGALLHMPICRVGSLKSTVAFLKLSGIRVVAATEKNQSAYTKSNLKPPIAIVMGSEDKGISDSVLGVVDEQVSIPVLGKVDSLNVSVAAGLLMYEVIRQKGL